MTAVNWAALAERLAEARTALVWGDHHALYGADRDIWVLRRALDAQLSQDGTYEVIRTEGLTTSADADNLVLAHVAVDRAAAQRAIRERDEARAELRQIRRDARQEAANLIREQAANEYLVPSRYRREGALLAADWLDGGAP